MNLPQDPQVMTASFVGAPGCSRPLAAILRQRDGKAACLNLMRGNRRLNVLEESTGDCPISCHLMDRESVKERLRQGD